MEDWRRKARIILVKPFILNKESLLGILFSTDIMFTVNNGIQIKLQNFNITYVCIKLSS